MLNRWQTHLRFSSTAFFVARQKKKASWDCAYYICLSRGCRCFVLHFFTTSQTHFVTQSVKVGGECKMCCRNSLVHFLINGALLGLRKPMEKREGEREKE